MENIRTIMPRSYLPSDVRSLRDMMGASQNLFAQLVGVSIKTIQGWEQGVRIPSMATRRLLDVIAEDPKAFHAKFIRKFKNT